MSTDSKSRRLCNLIGLKRATVSALVEICTVIRDQGDSGHLSQNVVHYTLEKEWARVGMCIDLPLTTGEHFKWHVARADHMLSYYVQEVPAFADLVDRRLANKGTPLSAIFYLDEVTPGNILRPDNKRKFWVWYVSFKEFGQCALWSETVRL